MDEIKNNIVNDEVEKVFPLWHILYKNLVLIICITVICGLLGTLAGLFLAKPVYTASSNMMLKVAFYDDKGATNEINNTTLSKRTLPTVADTVTSPDVVNEAKYIYMAKTNSDDISYKRINITYDENSLIFTISYVDAVEYDAEDKLSAVIEALKKVYKERQSTTFTDIEFVETQDYYTVTESSKLMMYILVGLLGGVIIAVAFALLVFILDNKVKDGYELEEITGTSVIAIIEKQNV
jgi:capsular polysaccharide biosynthesis protein